MEVQEILSGKGKLIEYLKEKGFQEEKDYPDEEYKEGSYLKIDKRKLLVIYEIFEEDKIKEIKDHFLIDRGLSYCIIILDGKLIFFRNFGETKHFIYSERTKNNVSKIDKLKNITALDSLFQSKDISALFYEAFKVKRNLLVQNIKNDVEPVQKYLIAQKIFDRFFFIYFLCHKGIIKFKDGGKISGENLFTKILLKKGKFLENLKKLFHLFNSQEKTILEIGDYQIVIPYLNGGLFRPDVLEQDLDIKLKDEQWEEIFDFLNSYHWIIEDVKATEENEEKILTPEILGHVYERSVVEWESEGFEKEAENAVKKITERKKKGVYYTPESITDYISNNTIVPYLLDKLGNKYASFDELIESKNKKDMKEGIKILDEIKVLDPACGSGAFLIKASEVILSLKRRLSYEIKEKKNFYDLKLDIITENIYGVDILAGAIEISKLRLWLWLISDFEESKNEIKALPNIEYNLKVGNSLVGWLDEKLVQMPMNTPLTEKVDGIFTGLIAFSENGDGEDLKKARELLRAYKLNDYIEAYYILYKIYRRTHGLKAENLRSILETIRKSIYATVTPAFLDYVNKKIKPNYDSKKPPITQEEFTELSVFHWRIDFGHIILNGGFDMVIANPPYVPFQKINKKEKKVLDVHYHSSVGKYDLYVLFKERSLKLINNNCFSCFIMPNKFIKAGYGEGIKSILLDNTLVEIVDFKDIQLFENATNYPCIILVRKINKKHSSFNYFVVSEILDGQFLGNSCKINQDKLDNGTWILEKSESEDIINKLNKFEKLETYARAITQGIRTGSLKVYYNEITEDNIRAFGLEKEIIFPVFDGKNVKGYYNTLSKSKSKLIFPYDVKSFKPLDIKKYPQINIYLSKHKKELLERKDSGKIFSETDKLWYEFWDPKPITFEKPKIVFPDISIKNNFYLEIEGIPYLNTCYAIYLKEDIHIRFILGILNSKLIEFFFKKISPSVRGGFYRYKTDYINKIPINYNLDKIIISLVDQILLITESKDYPENREKQKKVKELQDKIDQLVYKLYDLTPEEIKIVEDFCEGK